MSAFIDRIQAFVNDPATVQVLQFLVLLMALLWLLSGGFRLRRPRRGRHRDRKGKGE